jgi:plastocyanin
MILKIITTVIIIALIIAPTLQLFPRTVQGTNPTYSVAIVDYEFQPLHINIKTGTTVLWTYTSSGKDYHTVTSNPGTNKTQGGTPLLNSGTLSPGQSFSYAFNQPGHYPYQCSFHPAFALMNGWVNVTGAPVTPSSNPTPQLDYTLITVFGAVAAVAIVATVGLFVRMKKRRASVTPTST